MARLSHALTGGLPWLPVDACTLPTAERPLRAAEFDRLFRDDLAAVSTTGPSGVVLGFANRPGLVDELDDLVRRESACCSFFDFSVTATDGKIELTVEVPAQRADVLAGLVTSAQKAWARRKP